MTISVHFLERSQFAADCSAFPQEGSENKSCCSKHKRRRDQDIEEKTASLLSNLLEQKETRKLNSNKLCRGTN